MHFSEITRAIYCYVYSHFLVLFVAYIIKIWSLKKFVLSMPPNFHFGIQWPLLRCDFSHKVINGKKKTAVLGGTVLNCFSLFSSLAKVSQLTDWSNNDCILSAMNHCKWSLKKQPRSTLSVSFHILSFALIDIQKNTNPVGLIHHTEKDGDWYFYPYSS